MDKPKIELINSRPFYTDKVQIILELLIPMPAIFDQTLYIETWLKTYSLLTLGLISIEELIQIGNILQTKNLPKGESLGAFTQKPFFDLLEYSSEVIYKYGTNKESVDFENARQKIEGYAVELREFKA